MASKKVATGKGDLGVVIAAPNFQTIYLKIKGNASYVSNAFGEEAQNMMKEDMLKGQQDKKRGNKKPPKDFEAGYRGSLHRAKDGWYGIPCTSLRHAMVRAAQLCGIEMTKAKMCVFVLPDGEQLDGTPLVRINGEPERFDSYVRNSNGSADIRARARFSTGWTANVSIRFDADFLSANSVVNLLSRAGISVGIGAGRPFSTMSVGQGWGTFDVLEADDLAVAAE